MSGAQYVAQGQYGPPQPGQGQSVDPAAHAAAWAAYYAAQGQPNPYATTPGAVSSAPNGGPVNGNTAYANYGYGVGTAHANQINPAQPPQPPQQQQGQYGGAGYQYPSPAGPTPPPFRPGPGPPGSSPAPPQNYGAAPGQGYPQGAPFYPQNGPPNAGFRPPLPNQNPPQVQNQGQGGQYGYQSPSPAGPFQPGQPPMSNTPYYPGNQYNQQNVSTQATPMGGGYNAGPQPPNFRPGPGPSGPQNQQQNRPYSPRPPQPPMGMGGMQGGMNQGMGPPQGMGMGMGGTPPAKRPRFDNSRPQQPQGMGMNSGRPPPSNAGPSSYPSRPPSSAPPSSSSSRPPIVRPPIHLGMGGPPPPGIGIPPRGPAAASTISVPRPGARGKHGSAVQMHVNVNVPGAPRGPSGMGIRAASGVVGGKRSADDRERDRERDRKRRERERDIREREDKNNLASGVKATMTDFRIVGIELKGAATGDVDGEGHGEMLWKWGLTGEEARQLHPANAIEESKAEKGKAVKKEDEKSDKALTAPSAVPLERSVSGDEEGKGRKRKANSPDVDDAEGSHKKRAAHDVKDGSASPAAVKAEPLSATETATAVGSDVSPAVEPITATENKPESETAAATDEVKPKVEIDGTTPSEPAKPLADAETAKDVKPSTKKDDEPRSKYEESQNRFRIYFESPAELDRIPKALRRGNKRWRRESTAPRGSTPVPTGAGAGAGNAIVAAGTGSGGAVVEASIPEVPVVEAVEDSTAGGVVEAEPQTQAEAAAAEVAESTQSAVAPEADAVVPNANTATNQETAALILPEEQETTEKDADLSMISVNKDAIDAAIAEAGEPVEPAIVQVAEDIAADSVPTMDGTTEVTAAATDDITPAAAGYPAVTADAAPATPAPEISTITEDPATARERERQEREAEEAKYLTHQPSVNRISILYEESSRRICLDADVVESIRVFREEGRIEVDLRPVEVETVSGADTEETGEQRKKGVLVEMYDNTDERFVPLSNNQIDEIHSAPVKAEQDLEKVDGEDEEVEDRTTIPPLHRATRTLIVWLNKRKALSEPKWLKSNSADEWLYEMFGPSSKSSSSSAPSSTAIAAWRGKLSVMDPDPVPTLRDILTTWSTTCSMGKFGDRQTFVSSLLADPADLLEILLRLARGDRNPSVGGGGGGGFGSLASGIRHDSPYASHQTHVSLAVLQMYKLTMAYAKKAMDVQGEKEVKEKMEDIVKSLPVGMIQKSLDGLFREWGEKRA